MGFRSCLSLPVVSVLLVIGFVYYTVVFLVIDPWLDLGTSSGLLNAIAFTYTTFMALFSYALAILRDPGQIPSTFHPDPEEDSQLPLQEVKRKGGGRFCQKCRLYKPARAHHCRLCKRCVLRMDHHCLWINNCVGHSNYKAFFLFLSYITAASVHSLVLLGGHAVQDFGESLSGNDAKGAVPASTLVKIFCGVLLLPISIALSVLLSWHIFLALHNKTTIEYYEGVRAKWHADKSGLAYRHPYDLGVVSNLLTIFGPRVTCWCCPTYIGHIGSGLHFKTFEEGL